MDVKAGPSKIMSPHNAAEVTETKMPKEVKQLKKIISVTKKTPNKEATGTAAKNANKTVKPIIVKMACGATFEIKNKKQSTSAKSKAVKTADSKIPDAPSKPRKVTKPETQTSKNATTTKNQTSSKAADNKTTKKDADKQKKEKASTAKATSKDTEKEATKKPRTTTKTSNEKEPQPGGSTSKPKTTKALKSTEKPSAIPKLITKTTATTRSTTKATATPKTATKTTATPGSTTKTTTTPKSATKTTATPKSTTKTTASARTTRSRKQEPTSEADVSFHNEILEEMQNLRASMNRLSLEYREKSLDKPVRRRVHFKDFPAIEENEEHEIEESVPQNGTFTVFQNTAGNVKAEEDNAFLSLPSGSNIHDTTYDLNDAYESDDNDDGKLDGTYNIIDSADDEMDDENKKNDDQATTNDDNIEKLIDDKLINEKVDLYDNLEEKLKLEKSKKLKLLTVKPRKYEDDLRNERKKLKKNKKERKICKALLEMSIYVAKHFDGDDLSSDESSDSSPCSCCSSYEDEETCSCSDCESSSTYYSSTETASTDDESSDNYCYKKKTPILNFFKKLSNNLKFINLLFIISYLIVLFVFIYYKIL